MDPTLIALIATLGAEAVINVIQAWKKSGGPTDEDIRALQITKDPEDILQRK